MKNSNNDIAIEKRDTLKYVKISICKLPRKQYGLKV